MKTATDAYNKPPPALKVCDRQRIHENDDDHDEVDDWPCSRCNTFWKRIEEADPEGEAEEQDEECRELKILVEVKGVTDVPLEDEYGVDPRLVPNSQIDAEKQREYSRNAENETGQKAECCEIERKTHSSAP